LVIIDNIRQIYMLQLTQNIFNKPGRLFTLIRHLSDHEIVDFLFAPILAFNIYLRKRLRKTVY